MGGLTHYASGPAPVLFGAGYTPVATWWKVGLTSSIVTLAIFGTVGTAWTKLLGASACIHMKAKQGGVRL